jgi:hypothetical protein
MTPAERAKYLAENGWPLTLKGTPRPIGLMDHGELIQIARRYGLLLANEIREYERQAEAQRGLRGREVAHERT